MKHLIVFAHPAADSLNAQLKNGLVAHLQGDGHDICVRDLYQLNFNPVLSLADIQGQRKGRVEKDVAEEQKWVQWAEHITFIYPIWWTGLPAVLKGYIDRVFSYGFAYRYDQGIQQGLLQGRQVTIINTHGKSKAYYERIAMDTALRLTSDTGIYSYCGLELSHHFFFDQADRATAQQIGQWQQQIINKFNT